MVGMGLEATSSSTAPESTGAVSRRSASPARSAPTVRAEGDPLSPTRIKYLSKQFGRSNLADMIGVRPAHLTRWPAGYETPSPAVAVLLIDLDHIFARARLIWGADAAKTWITSANSFLGGATPAAVLRQYGCSRVLEALNAEKWGSSA